MGMTPQEVDFETSIQARGQDAVKMIARINTAYEKLNVSKRANAKAKAKRSRVEKPGSGFETQTKSTIKELKKQAQKTGDWHSFFLAMEE